MLQATFDPGVESVEVRCGRRKVGRHCDRECPLCGIKGSDASLQCPVAGDGARNADQHEPGNPHRNGRDRRQQSAGSCPRPAHGTFDGHCQPSRRAARGAAHWVAVTCAVAWRWW